MAALSDPQSWKRGSSLAQMQQLPQLPESAEEQMENASGGHNLHDGSHWSQQVEGQPRQIEDDLRSELSFTSAYSSPRDSSDTLQHLETTV